MKIAIACLLVLLATPGLAQDRWEVALGLNLLSGEPKTTLPGAASGPVQSITIKGKAAVAPSVVLGFRALDLAGSDLTLTGEFQFPTNYHGTYEVTSIPSLGGMVAVQQATVRIFHYAPGIQWNFHRRLDFGAGLQYRFEHMAELGGLSLWDNRFWLDPYLGYTLPERSGMTPFLNLRLALALSRTRQPSVAQLVPGSDAATRQLLRASAGTGELSIQSGIRF